VVIVAVFVGGVGISAALRGPSFVDHVRVDNRSGLSIDVDVAGASGDDWVAVGIARPHGQLDAQDVVDQGGRWIFRFRASGVDGGGVEITRDRLQASRWTIEIPQHVIDALRRGGATDVTGADL